MSKLLEGFNEPALKVLMLAQEEAFRLKHSECDTGEVLIALITDGDEARRSLVEHDANAEIARSIIKKTLGSWDGKKLPMPIPFSSQTTQVLEQARVWSCEMGNEFVGPGHILLGLLDLRNSVAFQVLDQMAVSPEKLQNRIKEELAVVAKQQDESAAIAKLCGPLERALQHILRITSSNRSIIWLRQDQQPSSTAELLADSEARLRRRSEAGPTLTAITEVSSNNTTCYQGMTVSVRETGNFIREFHTRATPELLISITDIGEESQLYQSTPTLSALIELSNAKASLIVAVRLDDIDLGFLELQRWQPQSWTASDREVALAVASLLEVILKQY